MLYDSIIACFGTRFTVNLMPDARRYRVFPLGTFHYFDWQKSGKVGISIGTCPQIVTTETAQIGVRVGDTTRILPFADGEIFADIQQHITPLTTVLDAADPVLPVTVKFTFCSAFYPQSFEYSAIPGYCLEVEITNPTSQPVTADAFFALPLDSPAAENDSLRAVVSLTFPDGIDHDGIDGLTFEQIIAGDGATITDNRLTIPLEIPPGATQTARFYHVGYIPQPTLNQRGNKLKFGYTTLWDDAAAVLHHWRTQHDTLIRKGNLFESTVTAATVPHELKAILASTFKGLACNAWWAENDWFSIMEIGAYHGTLDVDYQLALFFFQYWADLLRPMLNQWADYYRPGSGYMAHDLGQHLEATGNRYGGPDSAMKVEENCNYIILLHHYWRSTGDDSILQDKENMLAELLTFLLAADTNGSGLPDQYADNTNDWGSGLITASAEQSYHGVRLIAAYTAYAQIAQHSGSNNELARRTERAIEHINRTFGAGWLGDHYPISFADSASFEHYSMWTTHGLLYPLRSGQNLPLAVENLRVDLINSTSHTLREHGSVHSTVDVRGWLTQNLWRDAIAAYLGVDHTGLLRRYLGHGEYVSYEDTTILEVANELMVVPGATAEHTHAGQTHDHPMVDGHPRPACAYGLLYALAGVQYDTITHTLSFQPVSFPLRIALTHLADWENESILWLTFHRSIPNQDDGHRPAVISYTIDDNAHLLDGWEVSLRSSTGDNNLS